MSKGEHPIYTHMQDGKFVRVFTMTVAAILLVPTIVLEFSVSGKGTGAGVLLVVVPVIIIVASMFSQMTIEVTDADIRWRFALGIPAGRVRRADLVDVVRKNPNSLYGIGMHLTLKGMLWNVAVGPAVALRRRDGREILLGTDDPDGLIAALR